MLVVMMNKKYFLERTYHYKKRGVKMEKNEIAELKEYLIENDFPQSFIDLLEDLSINDLLTIFKR